MGLQSKVKDNLFKVVELSDSKYINNINIIQGQYIITDDSKIYYDIDANKRILVSSNNKVSIYEQLDEDTRSFEAIMKATKLNENPIIGDVIVLKKGSLYTIYFYGYVYETNEDASCTLSDLDWIKVDNNITASSIYFSENIRITNKLDGMTNEDAPEVDDLPGVYELQSEGRSLTDVMQMIFGPDKYPDVEEPKFNVTLYLDGKECLENTYVEYNTKHSIGYRIECKDGYYELSYKDGNKKTEAGLLLEQIKITPSISKNIMDEKIEIMNDYLDEYVLDEKNAWDLTFVDDSDSNFKKVYVDFYFNYAENENIIPTTLLGNKCENLQIKTSRDNDDNKVKSIELLGYNEGFYYGFSKNVINESDLSENIFRDNIDYITMTKTNAPFKSGKYNMTVKSNTSTIILACPSDVSGVKHIQNNTVNQDMNVEFNLNNPYKCNILDKEYNVWLYTPALPYVNDTSLTITL